MTATIPMGPHAVVTLTLDDASPTRAAAEMSRRRFDHDDEKYTKPNRVPQSSRQRDWSR